jgi:hypothetical protein
MADVFQVLKSSTIQSIFQEEWQYIVDHRWEFAQNKPSYLILLDSDQMSLKHLDDIQRMIQAEKAAIAKKEDEAQKKVRSGSSLTGSHGNY